MDDEKTVEALGTNGGSFPKKNDNTQEQSTAAPTVPGEDNGAEQPVAEHVGTNELNDGTEPSKDNEGADDQRVSEGDGEPENAKDDGDRDTKD